MFGRVPFCLVSLFFVWASNAAIAALACHEVPIAVAETDLSENPELWAPAFVLTGSLSDVRPGFFPALTDPKTKELLQQIVADGHGIAFLPTLWNSARVISPKHGYSKYLLKAGFALPRSEHWVLFGTDCDYFTVFHEKVHLGDLALMAELAPGLSRLLDATSFTERYRSESGKVILTFLFEQRAETKEREERSRLGVPLGVGRLALLKADAKQVSGVLDIYKLASPELYGAARSVLRDHALEGDFALSALLPDHF